MKHENSRAGESCKQWLQRVSRAGTTAGRKAARRNLRAFERWQAARDAAGKTTRRNWWDVISGKAGSCTLGDRAVLRVGQKVFVFDLMVEAAERQGRKPLAGSIETGLKPIGHRTPQKRWGTKLRTT